MRDLIPGSALHKSFSTLSKLQELGLMATKEDKQPHKDMWIQT